MKLLVSVGVQAIMKSHGVVIRLAGTSSSTIYIVYIVCIVVNIYMVLISYIYSKVTYINVISLLIILNVSFIILMLICKLLMFYYRDYYYLMFHSNKG